MYMVVNCRNLMVNILTHFLLDGENQYQEFQRFLLEVINKLVHFINGSHDIPIILVKRCIKQSWKMLNSEYELYNKIVKYSMCNANNTLGENVRYFMYKCNLRLDDWN